MPSNTCDGFATLVERLKNRKPELLKLVEEARKNRDLDRLELLEQVLDDRYPGWDKHESVIASQHSNKQPIVVSFRGSVAVFDHAKDAYVWVMERFVAAKEIPLTLVNPRADSRKIARTLEERLVRSPCLRDDARKWHKLNNGWNLELVPANDSMQDVLFAYAAAAEFSSSEWSWKEGGKEPPSLDHLLRGLI